MPTKIEEQALCNALEKLEAFGEMGLTAILGEHDEIIIARRGHVRGIWHCAGPVFAWVPAGYSATVYEAADVATAVAYTREVIMVSSKTIL
jgi:hypothetical protein